MQAVEADPDLIRGGKGRSLPYGEGSSFWALAEMVKAETSDSRNRLSRGRRRGDGAASG